MAAGLGFIALQTVGEVAYWRFYRKDRDEEIQQEKDQIELERQQQKKMVQFQSLSAEEQEAE